MKALENNYRYILPWGEDVDVFKKWCDDNLSDKATFYGRPHMVNPFVSTPDPEDITLLIIRFGKQ